MEYEINPQKINNLTALPHEVIEYISEISEENLKVLLLIFSEKFPLNLEDIALKLNLKFSQVEESIEFWKFKKILNPKTKEALKKEIKKPCVSQISSTELANAKKEDKFIKMLFEESERLFCRPLKPIERRTLMYIYEYYNLSVDIILMVVDFCIRNGRSLKNITSICEDFSNNNLTSHEQAEKQIQFLTEKLNIENQIRSCFGISGRTLSVNEKKLIFRWTSTYNYKINMIKLAFDRCVDCTGKLSFQYIEKILSNWKKNNINSPKDLKKTTPSKKYSNNKKTSYNLEQLLAKSDILIAK